MPWIHKRLRDSEFRIWGQPFHVDEDGRLDPQPRGTQTKLIAWLAAYPHTELLPDAEEPKDKPAAEEPKDTPAAEEPKDTPDAEEPKAKPDAEEPKAKTRSRKAAKAAE